MSNEVTLALITFATLVINLMVSLWRENRDRKWKREDAEWKEQAEARGKRSLQQTEALNEKADANMVVSTAAADASQTAVAVGVKAAAAASGEPEHKVLAEVQSDLNRRLRGVFGLGEPDASEAEATRGSGNHGPR